MKTFNERVYDIVRQIPYGKVMSYVQIAQIAGSPRASRTVGYALYATEDNDLPCHRVVFKDGALSVVFFSNGVNKQYHLLKAENITFSRDKKVKMNKHQWDAATLEIDF